jgi:hypothetical protein
MDSKLRLRIVDPKVDHEYGLMRSREILSMSIKIVVVRTLMLIASSIDMGTAEKIDYVTIIGRACAVFLHYTVIFLQHKYPLKFYKYHASLLTMSMLDDQVPFIV